MKINDLEIKKLQINSMLQSHILTSQELKSLNKKINDRSKAASDKVEKEYNTINTMSCQCQIQRVLGLEESKKLIGASNSSDPCKEMNDKMDGLNEAQSEATWAKTEGEAAVNQLQAYSAENSNLQGIVNDLDAQIKELQTELKTVPKPVPLSAADASGKNELSQDEIEQNWMSFSFDSVSSTKEVDTSSETYKAALSFSVGGLLWSVSGGASYSRSQQDFAQQMSKSDVAISGKFLRVTMNRDWFHPSIFSIGGLRMVSVV